MADLAERLGQIVGRVAVVFDDQETHARTGPSLRISDFPSRRERAIAWGPS